MMTLTAATIFSERRRESSRLWKRGTLVNAGTAPFAGVERIRSGHEDPWLSFSYVRRP